MKCTYPPGTLESSAVACTTACAYAVLIAVSPTSRFIPPKRFFTSSTGCRSVSLKLARAVPSSILLYRSAIQSYSVFMTFTFASTPRISCRIVTVSQRETFSSAASSAYSGDCHRWMNDAVTCMEIALMSLDAKKASAMSCRTPSDHRSPCSNSLEKSRIRIRLAMPARLVTERKLLYTVPSLTAYANRSV